MTYLANIYKLGEYGKNNSIGAWVSEKYLWRKYFVNKNSLVLEIGCGHGRSTFDLAKLGFKKVYGIDLSEKLIERANKNKDKFDVNNIEFKIMSVTNMDFPNNYFEYCYNSYNTLDCVYPLKERINAIKEIYRVLKQDGIYIHSFHSVPAINYGNKKNFIIESTLKTFKILLNGGSGYIYDKNREYEYYSTVKKEIKLFEKVGFKVIKIYSKNEIEKSKRYWKYLKSFDWFKFVIFKKG